MNSFPHVPNPILISLQAHCTPISVILRLSLKPLKKLIVLRCLVPHAPQMRLIPNAFAPLLCVPFYTHVLRLYLLLLCCQIAPFTPLAHVLISSFSLAYLLRLLLLLARCCHLFLLPYQLAPLVRRAAPSSLALLAGWWRRLRRRRCGACGNYRGRHRGDHWGHLGGVGGHFLRSGGGYFFIGIGERARDHLRRR